MQNKNPELNLEEKIQNKIVGWFDKWFLDKLPSNLIDTLGTNEVVAIFVAPNNATSREIGFKFNAFDLKPNQKIIVLLPQASSGILNNLQLWHRKREQFWNKIEWNYDPYGAYSEIRVFDWISQNWQKWKDPAWYSPIKYAERRHDIEYENLHDWTGTVGNINPLAVEIRSAWEDPHWSTVTIYSLDVITYPTFNEKTKKMGRIYSSWTVFLDFPEKDKFPQYGWGKAKWHYNDAIALWGANGKEHFSLTKNVKTDQEYLDSQNYLHIKLPPNKRILSLEVAIWDTWYNYKWNWKLQLGWAKFFATLQKANWEKDDFMRNINIPPQWILSGWPVNSDYITQEWDEIILQSNCTSYLMWWRILYEDIVKDWTSIIDDTIWKTWEETQKILEKLRNNLDLIPLNISAGWTQWGEWFLDKNSNCRFIVKAYEKLWKEKLDRCVTEYIANKIYGSMWIPAAESQIYQGKIAIKEIPNATHLPYSFSKSKIDNQKDLLNILKKYSEIKDWFVIDAWLANGDVFGLNYDNILISENKAYRIDAWGSLFYRAMWQKKLQFANEKVTEIETMRSPEMAKEAGFIFQNLVLEQDIKTQVTKLCKIMTDTLINQIVMQTGISNDKDIVKILINRKNWLKQKYL